MKKIVLLLNLFVLLSFFSKAQIPTYVTSHNMTAAAASYSPTTPINRSLRVRFEIQNDSITLIDSFISDQPFIDSFIHTDLSANTFFVDYTFESPAFWGPGPMACASNQMSGINDSIYVYSYRLFQKDSFQNKTIRYKGNYYNLTGLGTPNWSFSPNEYDIDSLRIMNPYYGGNISFYMNQECPVGITVSNDSILIQVAIEGSSGPGHQLLREDSYSTTDSFNLRLQVPCANLFTLDNRIFCYNIYVSDTSNISSLDIKMNSLNSSHPNIGTQAYWFHYDNSGTSVYTAILATVPVEGLELRANDNGNYNQLNWITQSEKNTSHSNIKKSYDGINFVSIGSIQTIGNSDVPYQYFHEDEKVESNKSAYYRIDIFDIDQKRTSSNVVFLSQKSKTELVISPNPFQNKITIQGLETVDYEIVLSALDGRVLKKSIIAPNNSHQLNLLRYPKGVYFLSLRNLETREVITKKIIKE